MGVSGETVRRGWRFMRRVLNRWGAPLRLRFVDSGIMDNSEQKQEKPLVDPHNMARDAKGRFLPGQMPNTALSLSHERAVEMGKRGAERKRELAAKYARKYVTEAVQAGGLDAKGPSEAVGMMAGEFAKSALANAMDKPRDAVPAAKLALRLADMLPEDRQRAAVAAVQVIVNGGDVTAMDAEWADE